MGQERDRQLIIYSTGHWISSKDLDTRTHQSRWSSSVSNHRWTGALVTCVVYKQILQQDGRYPKICTQQSDREGHQKTPFYAHAETATLKNWSIDKWCVNRIASENSPARSFIHQALGSRGENLNSLLQNRHSNTWCGVCARQHQLFNEVIALETTPLTQ